MFGLERPICYLNRRLRSAGLNYAATRNQMFGRWFLELRQSDGLWNCDSPTAFGTTTVRWSLELRQSDGLWNCDSPMVFGTATVLVRCSASCWKRQFTTRSSESTFHDYFHLVWFFDELCVCCIYELDDVLTQDSVFF